MARYFGDRTAEMLGRLSLNPLRHIDPVGTVLVPGILLATSGMLFGWAKPVPITIENFKHPKRDNALVAAAGPVMNLFLSLVALVLLGVLGGSAFFGLPESSQNVLFEFLHFFFWLNFGLALFNLLPIYPLDGSWILKSLLPDRLSYQLSRVDHYGIWVFFGVLAFCPSFFNYLFLPAIGGLFWTLHAAGLGQLADMIGMG